MSSAGSPPVTPYRLIPQYLQNAHAWVIVVATIVWLTFTIIYAVGVAYNHNVFPVPNSPAVTVRILRVLSEGVSLLLNALIAGTLNAALWTTASTKHGLSISTLLGLSTSTTTTGLIELLFWGKTHKGKDTHRIIAIIRLLLFVLIPLMGVLILSTVDYNVTYTVLNTFTVTAGIGAFNVSQLVGLLDSKLAFQFGLASYNLLSDTTSSVSVSPAICYETSPCSTYYFTGGVAFLNPDLFVNSSLTPDADVIIVRKSQGLLVSYWDVTSSEPDQVQCQVLGVSGGAIELCFGFLTSNVDHIVAVDGCYSNTSWTGPWTLGTAMAVKFATADTIYSRLNSSILSIENLTPLNDTILTINSDSNGNLDYNSTTFYLLDYIINAASGGVVGPTEVLRAWLVAPLIMLQPNSYTNPLFSTIPPNTPASFLPYLETTADLAQSGVRASIAPWTAIFFFVVAIATLLGCLACLIWTLTEPGPPITRFPLIDFASRAVTNGVDSETFAQVLMRMSNGDKKRIRKELRDKAVFLGDVNIPISSRRASAKAEAGEQIEEVGGDVNTSSPDRNESQYGEAGVQSGKIGFVLREDHMRPLEIGKSYE